jgi:AcrR family transcriptional regulator
MAGEVADRAVERAVEAAKTRARDDVQQLIAAGLTVLRREGAAEMTIAEVLTEAGLSTRAFYRHFTSKSDLLLAIYEHEVQRYNPLLQRRLDAASGPAEALVAWIDELLAAGFEPRRGERTRAMFGWAIPLQQEFPAEFAAIRAALTDPLEAVLAGGLADGTFPTTDPARDATFIRALTWELVDEHLSDPSSDVDVVAARDAVLRFALPALGADQRGGARGAQRSERSR